MSGGRPQQPDRWQAVAAAQQETVDYWYRKIVEAGHGKITITVHRASGRIEVRPALSIVTTEEQAIYGEGRHAAFAAWHLFRGFS